MSLNAASSFQTEEDKEITKNPTKSPEFVVEEEIGTNSMRDMTKVEKNETMIATQEGPDVGETVSTS
jgi:hypothetical protein